MKLKAIIHKAEEGGYWAEVPALPGCVTQSETLPELHTKIKEAIEGWLSIDDVQEEDRPGDKVIEIAI
jgi:predicted RNase H-like HicB family nuclease